MPYQFLVIPFSEDQEVFDDQVFRKLEKKARIRNCQATFFQSKNGKSYWAVFVEYENKQEVSNENRPKLTDNQKAVYEALRGWRNEQAEKDGVPPYLLATNRQLEISATLNEPTLEKLSAIKGFGKAKMEKYGTEFIRIIKETQVRNETD